MPLKTLNASIYCDKRAIRLLLRTELSFYRVGVRSLSSLIIASLIFLLTLVLVIWQPKGLSIGWIACAGGALALLAGVVSFHDVAEVTSIVWNATLTLVALIIISLVLDEVGFFEWAALHMARMAKGRGMRLYLFLIVLGAIVSAFFANDGGALILTPIVLAMVRALNYDERVVLVFIIGSGFVADTTSLPFTISNLVNIVSADFFGIGFNEYATRMIVPDLFALLGTLIVLYLFSYKVVPKTYNVAELKRPSEAIRDHKMFRLSWWIMGALFAGYLASQALAIPVSIIAGAIAIVLLVASRRSPAISTKAVLKGAPWAIVFFSIGMYVVVYGLQNVGLTHVLTEWLETFASKGLFAATVGMGALAAVLSSVMNNLPTVMINALAISDSHTNGIIREALIYANVIGSDLGPKMTPIGSLATLLWLHVLAKKGVYISWRTYVKVGVVITIPVLLFTLVGLYVWLKILS